MRPLPVRLSSPTRYGRVKAAPAAAGHDGKLANSTRSLPSLDWARTQGRLSARQGMGIRRADSSDSIASPATGSGSGRLGRGGHSATNFEARMLRSLWRKKAASTPNCSTRCATTCWLALVAVDALASISWAATELTTRSSLRGIMSSCTGTSREPGLSQLVVKWGVERLSTGIRLSHVTDCIRVKKRQSYRMLAYPAATFPMSP
jgi:hypothetical protein